MISFITDGPLAAEKAGRLTSEGLKALKLQFAFMTEHTPPFQQAFDKPILRDPKKELSYLQILL